MMRSIPTHAPAAATTRARRILWRLGMASILLLLLLAAFEVGIRHVPPDGMTVTYQTSTLIPSSDGSFRPRFTYTTYTYTAPKDQQTIRGAYAVFNAAPVEYIPVGELAGCSLRPDPSPVVFTWHGVPVESWTSVGCAYFESAGGVSDGPVVDEHYVLHDVPYITLPSPSPNAG